MSDDGKRDELAATAVGPSVTPDVAATVPPTLTPSTASAPASPAVPLRSLGRYRIERQLGAGGMGVVYAAFDPSLERRIALKVLHDSNTVSEANQRLLREARAMARLVHPNVVTVHEVATADGRDYVAMEMINGENVAEWLKKQPRTEEEVVEVFLAAGKGLAAAHAAGIVHRDFKPHNVLRDGKGRVVVTDFGLARDAHDASAMDPMSVTMPAASASGSTPLSGLTQAGSLLGTPAYMAPEQWEGGTVTPATDQFAYCVALWEGLAGERPFKGASIDEIRAAVERGVEALDSSKLPPRLREVVCRGLATDPKLRWPSMEALLDQVRVPPPVQRRRSKWLPIGIGVAAVGLVGVVYAVTRSPAVEPAIASCAAPAIDPGAISLPSRATERRVLEAELGRWKTAREQACGLDVAVRAPRLSCLDGVLARIEVVAHGVANGVEAVLPALPAVDVGRYLIDPKLCTGATPPRLTTTMSKEFRDTLAQALKDDVRVGPASAKTHLELVESAKPDPCAAALAHRLAASSAREAAERGRQLGEAERAAERCGDDRLRAEVMIAAAANAVRNVSTATIAERVKLAEAAIARVAQPNLTADLEVLHMVIAASDDRVDDAIRHGEAAMAGYAARNRTAIQIATGLHTLDIRATRSMPDDLVRIRDQPREWRALAARELGDKHQIVHLLDQKIAAGMFYQGDVAGAHERLAKLRKPQPQEHPRRIKVRVLDGGKPVAGATVTAAVTLPGSSAGAGLAWPDYAGAMRVATTSSSGEVEIPDAPDDGWIIAELGDRRALPLAIADSVTLTLEPTGHLEGRVDLQGETASRVLVVVQDQRLPATGRYFLFAPVGRDGSFVISGAPRAQLRVSAQLMGATTQSRAVVTVDARTGSAKDIRLAIPNQKRTVHVVVRSTVNVPVGNASVLVMPGVQKSATVDKLDLDKSSNTTRLAKSIDAANLPAPVSKVARAGDLFATMAAVPDGVATACAVGLPSNLDASVGRAFQDKPKQIEVRCTPIPAGADVVVVEVPPWPRFE